MSLERSWRGKVIVKFLIRHARGDMKDGDILVWIVCSPAGSPLVIKEYVA